MIKSFFHFLYENFIEPGSLNYRLITQDYFFFKPLFLPFFIFFSVSTFLLILGFVGVALVFHSLIIIFLSLELSLLASYSFFLFIAYFFSNPIITVYSVIVLAFAGTESAVGLSFLVGYYRSRGHVSPRLMLLRG